jgi:hypothetical protein
LDYFRFARDSGAIPEASMAEAASIVFHAKLETMEVRKDK